MVALEMDVLDCRCGGFRLIIGAVWMIRLPVYGLLKSWDVETFGKKQRKSHSSASHSDVLYSMESVIERM